MMGSTYNCVQICRINIILDRPKRAPVQLHSLFRRIDHILTALASELLILQNQSKSNYRPALYTPPQDPIETKSNSDLQSNMAVLSRLAAQSRTVLAAGITVLLDADKFWSVVNCDAS